MKTAILGAGVSGLALARFLVERGRSISDLHLFEAAPVAGGLCGSKTVDGFTYDTAGGHILFSKDAPAMQWMKDQSGGDEAFVQRDRNTKIRFEQEWVHYPFENGLGDLPEQANYDCLAGYVKAWHERDKHATEAPADFAGWVRWRFGDGIAEHFMDPYNAKIWKRPLGQITSEWVAGRVPDAPVEDVLKASIGMRTEGYTHQAIFYYPKRDGFQWITDGLYEGLKAQVRLSTPVESLERVGDRYSVNGEDFDAVVSTIPLNLVPDFLQGLEAGEAEAMRSLEYNSMTCVLLALDRPEHPDLSWVYLPHEVQGPANRVTYMSNYSPGNAPEGKTSLMCEITGPGGAPYPGDEIEQQTIDGLVHAGLMTREELMFVDRTNTRFAYIVYDFQFAERKRTALAALERLGITPLGRFGNYDYHNSDQCVIAARNLADRLAEQAVTG
ncbi:MAG: FAD-dependent oxidoreductase [Planctomycetota bacterium]